MNDERRAHRRTPIARPAEERTAEQSTQEAGGLHAGLSGVRPGPGPELAHEVEADDVLNRSAEERYDTPRLGLCLLALLQLAQPVRVAQGDHLRVGRK